MFVDSHCHLDFPELQADLPAILEGIGEAAPHTGSILLLVEQVRARLAKQLCYAYRGDDGALPIVTLTPEWEAAFADALVSASHAARSRSPSASVSDE